MERAVYIPHSSIHFLYYLRLDLFVIIHSFIQQTFIETSTKYQALCLTLQAQQNKKAILALMVGT